MGGALGQVLPKTGFVVSAGAVPAFVDNALPTMLTKYTYLLAAGVKLALGAADSDGPLELLDADEEQQDANACDGAMERHVLSISPQLLSILSPDCNPQRHQGFCRYRFGLPCIFNALRLDEVVVPSADLGEIVKRSIGIALKPDVAESFAAALDKGAILLPSRRRLRWWRIKLDMMDMLWRRAELRQKTITRRLLVDSSPQRGWDFMFARAMEVVFDARGLGNITSQ